VKASTSDPASDSDRSSGEGSGAGAGAGGLELEEATLAALPLPEPEPEPERSAWEELKQPKPNSADHDVDDDLGFPMDICVFESCQPCLPVWGGLVYSE